MKLLSSHISPRLLPQRILKATAGKLVLLLLAVGLAVTLCGSAVAQEPSPTPQPSPGKNAAEKSATEKSAPEKNATQKSATEKGATEKNSAENNASEKNVSEKNASEKGTAEKNSTPAATDQTRSRRIVTTHTPERSEELTRNRLEAKKDPAAVDKTTVDPKLVALREEIESASTPQEKLRLRLSLVDQLVAAGRKRDAINELHSMAGEEQFDPPGFYNIANALARLGDSEAATTTYRKAIGQRNGRYSRALNNLGVVLMRLGRWDEAYDAFFSALQFESFHYAEASYNLGRLYAARGQNDLAIREWKRAVKVDPDHRAAAQALSRAGVSGSIRVGSSYSSYSASKPAPAGTALTTKRPIADSTKADSRLTSPTSSPDPRPMVPRDFTVDAETYNLLQRARNAREHDRNEEAVQAFRLVISRMGGYFLPANLELAYVLITLKRNDEALTSLQAVADRDGSYYPIVYFHLGRLYEFKGELELAQRNYEQVISLFGQNNPQFLLELSRVREKMGNFEGALTSTEAYAKEMERMGQKPDWTDARVAYLRKRLADSKAKQ